MKKYTLIAVLALFVVASLVSGSLAIYNSVVEVGEGDMEAASFVIKADGKGDSFDGNILNIAPGDKTSVDINVHNYDDEIGVTETDMKVVIKLKVDTDILPLIYALYDENGQLLPGQTTSTDAEGNTIVEWDSENAVFEKNVKKDIKYQAIFKWSEQETTPEGEPLVDTDYVNMPCTYSIDVIGTQITGSTYNDITDATDNASAAE